MGKIRNLLKKITPIHKAYRAMLEIYWKLLKVLRQKALQKHGKQLLNEMSASLKDGNIPFCCMYGTLLGLVRDSRLIDWDDDMDLYVIDSDRFSWGKLEEILTSIGMKKWREFEVRDKVVLQSYIGRGIPVDFYLVTVEDGYTHWDTFLEIPSRVYLNDGSVEPYHRKHDCFPIHDGLQFVDINGFCTCIPTDSEKVLEVAYGKNWRTPDPSFVEEVPEYSEIMYVKARY